MADEKDNANRVREHYSNRAFRPRGERNVSTILHLRNLNNFIKSVLIAKESIQKPTSFFGLIIILLIKTTQKQYVKPGMNVFDLCCGKGGDLLKYSNARINYLFGADISDLSIQEAQKRHRERSSFPADFVAIDCFKTDFSKNNIFPFERLFDLVSCQFALHYAFETEEKARIMMQNVTARLKPGGFFIGTLPDANFLVRRLKASNDLSFGNSIFKVTIDQKDNFPLFGHRYIFHLDDAIDDLDEYLTHFPTLVKLAAEFDLELEEHVNFHKFFYQHWRQNIDLIERMKVFNSEGTISLDEWEAAGVYTIFAFRKKGPSDERVDNREVRDGNKRMKMEHHEDHEEDGIPRFSE